MRHLVSILLAPVLGAVAYLLIGIGFAKTSDPGWSAGTVIALAALLAGGAVYGLLLLPRWSPLGLALTGAAFLGLTVWAVSDASGFQDVTPDSILGVAGAAQVPAGGITAVLAVPLLATLASSRRWRRLAYGVPALPGQQSGFNNQQPPAFNNQPPAYQQQQPPAFNAPPPAAGFDQPPAYQQPGTYGAQQPDPYGAPAAGGYPNNPIGAPYSGPPSYAPGSPAAPNYPDQQQQQNPYGAPPPFSPEQTRRL